MLSITIMAAIIELLAVVLLAAGVQAVVATGAQTAPIVQAAALDLAATDIHHVAAQHLAAAGGKLVVL